MKQQQFWMDRGCSQRKGQRETNQAAFHRGGAEKSREPGKVALDTAEENNQIPRGSGNDPRCSQYGAIMVFVKQTFQVGIILLLLLAVFGVLLTPDPSDDPAGVMVRPDKSRLLVTSLLVTPAVSLPPLTPTSRNIFSLARFATTTVKRDLICTRLC